MRVRLGLRMAFGIAASLTALAVADVKPASGQIFKVAGPSNLGKLVDPLDVTPGAFEANRRFLWFAEQQDVLVNDLHVNQGGPITGTVDTFLIFTDRVGTGPARNYDILLGFDEPIVGIITTSRRLNQTDSLLGLPLTAYPTGDGARGQEDADFTEWDPIGNTLLIHNRTVGNVDQIRVLTASVPEPGPMTMVLGALSTGSMLIVRRRRTSR